MHILMKSVTVQQKAAESISFLGYLENLLYINDDNTGLIIYYLLFVW